MVAREGPPANHTVPRLPSPSVGRESAQRHPMADPLVSSRSNASRQASRASLNSMFSEDSRALLLAKMTRKRADEDVVAMQNRINRLKMEEYRAHKNIDDTHNKADDIVRLKAQNELKARAKEKAKALQEEALRRERQQKTFERATRDANIRVRHTERHLSSRHITLVWCAYGPEQICAKESTLPATYHRCALLLSIRSRGIVGGKLGGYKLCSMRLDRMLTR